MNSIRSPCVQTPGFWREIGGVEARAVGITEKAERARGKRVGADQLADLRLGCVRRSAATLHIEAEAPALCLAAMDGQVRIAEHEAADDVGAARDRLKRQRAFTCSRDPVVLRVDRGWSPSTAPRAARESRTCAGGQEPASSHILQIGRAGAEHGHALLGDDPPERVRPFDGPS